ncbi:MAG: bifunctional (p)ppGpp synthetase/guanosine-3',5'-bis(diphosphate) 3'-pyrophosphohydrolase [Lachnospiraceae bacterium]|nr:bifunctional (p)ppGpp synthetase/guanosine-3',5'-bis(diphosphate) 3'-pyrophosphohydrolase [Lachnospiraceae bacterium]
METKGYYQLDNSKVDDNSRVEMAIRFAMDCHHGQTRKGTDIPFIVHPLEVMNILYGMKADANLVIAGLLHDVVEDTDTTIEEIRATFGDDVAGLVGGHTEDKSKTWEERKETEIRDTLLAPLRLKMLVLADKLANMRSIKKDYTKLGNALWERFNAGLRQQAWYYGEMTEALEDMQDYPEMEQYYCEFVGLYKDVFVVYFYDYEQGVLYQCNAMGEAYRLIKGSPEWVIMGEVIPEDILVVNRKYAEITEELWNQEFWEVIESDIKDITVSLLSNTEYSFRISIEEKRLCFEGSEYGDGCEEFFGKDEIDFYYKLDEDGTYRMLSLLRIRYGKTKSIEDILKEEFAVENGVNHFTDYCEVNRIPYEIVTI